MSFWLTKPTNVNAPKVIPFVVHEIISVTQVQKEKKPVAQARVTFGDGTLCVFFLGVPSVVVTGQKLVLNLKRCLDQETNTIRKNGNAVLADLRAAASKALKSPAQKRQVHHTSYSRGARARSLISFPSSNSHVDG